MQKAIVVGLGASGEACSRFLLKRGWSILATDTREAPPALARLQSLEHFEFVNVDAARARLDEVELVVLSPGISPFFSEVAPLVKAAQIKSIEVVGEIELFARELARLQEQSGYRPKLIGITGTNGKTTTTVLTGKMCEATGKKTCVAGNIGPNAVTELDKALEAGELPDVWVLELSSFQLQTTSSLECDAATILNLSQDHLDWHGGMQGYADAKARIFGKKTLRVLNRDDDVVMQYAQEKTKWCAFGAGAPKRINDWGLTSADGLKWLTWNQDDSIALSRRTVLTESCVQRLMPLDALQIRGLHNAMNALAALALTNAIGIALSDALRALQAYRGEAHRVQYVMTVDGVDYIDDSKGTNVGATVAALEGLGADGTKLLVILGGDGKGQDFAPIAEAMQRHARGALIIGRDAPLIEEALQGHAFPVIRCETLPEAVTRAHQMARQGDIVLLSPACASWDMFRDYAHRAAVFIETARSLS